MLDVFEPFAIGHFRHGTRQQHHSDASQFTTLGKGLTQLQRRPRGEGIAVVRAVDGDFGDAVILFEAYLFELPNLFPLSFFPSCFFFAAKILLFYFFSLPLQTKYQ